MKKLSVVVALALAVLLCAGCGKKAEPEVIPETPAPVVETPAVVEAEPVVEEPQLPEPPALDIRSWEFLYAGSEQGVSRYQPAVSIWEDQYMDSRCMEQTIAFIQAARDQGYSVWINVGLRNFEYSLHYYEEAIRQYGSAYDAAQHVFAAGCSEHSTGLAIDITDEMAYHANYYNKHDETVADTEVYQWMAEHCAEYGFIVRYPEGHEEHYGMACYAGHFRYVGVEAASYIMENGICFEEFLALYE